MKRKLSIVLLLFCTHWLMAQNAKFIGMSASVNTSIIDMKLERSATNAPVQVLVGGGAAYSTSLKEDLNVRFGLDFLSYKPATPRGYYDVCVEEGSDNSCLPVVNTTQLYLPVGLEFYINTDYKPIHSFFYAGLIPAFSVIEKIETIMYNYALDEIDRYQEKQNGFNFQDLYLAIGLSTEFLIVGSFKFFVEPQGRISLLFRKQNFVNPVTAFTVKIGARYRSEKKGGSTN